MEGELPMWISVRASQPVRYRAGLRFTDAPRVIDASALSADALAAIRADPVLAVEAADAPEEGAAAGDDDPRAAAIRDAAAGLGEADRNKDGSPKIGALREAAGMPDLTAEEARAALRGTGA